MSESRSIEKSHAAWQARIVERNVNHHPKERSQTYYYNDGLGGRPQVWLSHTPGVNIPMRVKKVWEPGIIDGEHTSHLQMNIGSEQIAYRLYRALEAYFEDQRAHPYFLRDVEGVDSDE